MMTVDSPGLNRKEAKAVETAVPYLCFCLGKEEYGIPLLSVKEVIALPDTTPIPQTPPYFLGIMNLRGQVISVIDLRTKLNIKPSDSTEVSVIICDLSPNCIGVVVDSINCVLYPSFAEISEKPEIQNNAATEYITNVYRRENQLVLFLDIGRTLSGTDHRLVASNPLSADRKGT